LGSRSTKQAGGPAPCNRAVRADLRYPSLTRINTGSVLMMPPAWHAAECVELPAGPSGSPPPGSLGGAQSLLGDTSGETGAKGRALRLFRSFGTIRRKPSLRIGPVFRLQPRLVSLATILGGRSGW